MFNTGQNGNKSSGSSRIRKGLTRRKKRLSKCIEEDEGEEQRTLSNKKVCIICGNSQEIVDLSSNPIMKKTMASYCEDDSVVSNETAVIIYHIHCI